MYEDFQEFFINRLIKLRTKKDVSARAMSLDIGQSENYIADIENKRYFPSMTVFTYICEYLNITPKDFFDDEIEFPAIYNELFNNLKELNEEQIININNIVKSILRKWYKHILNKKSRNAPTKSNWNIPGLLFI